MRAISLAITGRAGSYAIRAREPPIGAVWEIVSEGGEAAQEQVICVCSGAARYRLVRPLAR